MAEPEDPIEELPRQLAVGLGALAVVALVVAGVLGVVAFAGASYLLGDEASTASGEPTMYFPTPAPPSPRSGAEAGDGRGGDAEGRGGEADGPDGEADGRGGEADGRGGRIVLHVRPERAAPFERVRLFGRYPGGNGATLQVQRRQGRWVFFPTTATVQGGRFETWIQSGRRGVNEFRVVDRAGGARSKAVEVRIGRR